MSFRVQRKRIDYVEKHPEEVTHVPKGHFTVCWWVKGDKPETWVKADIYGPDGNVFLYGVLAGSIDELKLRVPEHIAYFS